VENPRSPSSARRAASGRARRAYTIVEVMMALAVLTLGVGGVIAMQKATLIANTNARNLVTATDVAQSWMERMRVDALAWTEVNQIPTLTPTEWLHVVGTNTAWFVPTTNQPSPNNVGTQPAGSSQADIMGADLMGSDPAAPAFCTQVRLTRFYNGASFQDLYRMIRVEVRVYWDKSGRQIDCSAAIPTDYQLSRYGFVYLVSAVLENNSPI
jgi:Tfp pilus assembly protein PilV